MSLPPESKGPELPRAIEHAVQCYEEGRLDEAAAACAGYLKAHPEHFDALHLAGVIKIAQGKPSDAVPLLTFAAKLRPRSSEAALNLGVALHDIGDFAGALAQSDRALALRPSVPEALNNRGNALRALARPAEALTAYESALALRFDYADALSNRGAALLDLGRVEEALASCDQALTWRSNSPQALFNRGNALKELGRHARALASYDEVLRLQPDHGGALTNKIAILLMLNRNEEALAVARTAISRNAKHVDVLINFGGAAHKVGRIAEALAAYEEALRFAPESISALRNRAAALRDLGRRDEALAGFEKLLALKPDDVGALYERGELLRIAGKPAEALVSQEKALAIEPGNPHALGGAAFTALTLCDFDKTDRYGADVLSRAEAGMVVAPFLMLNLTDEPRLHASAAVNFVRKELPAPSPVSRAGLVKRDGTIKLAYVSADFSNHATAHLIADLIERHDRTKFTVTGIALGGDDLSEMRARLLAAFDDFHDVAGMTDAAAAKLIRDLGTDIAIDLKGYTQDCRPGIFAARAAPLQVNYLGYPGTMAALFMDYLIADPIVLPLDEQQYVTEKIVHLPDCYQPNDTKRVVAEETPTREAAGLPASGFVFCCFNNTFKIRRPVFEVWMRLLSRVEGSVLWLLRANEAASNRLRDAAAALKIDPSRLVFADRVPHAEHLARHRLANVFLDTLPYNAHTTASDALWTGLPFVTCKGKAFPGRVGASLLTAIGLPDLIAPDLAAYEALAMRLATEPEFLADCKRRLDENRTTAPLFNIDRYRSHIEQAYTKMHELWRLGGTPQSFAVTAS